MAANYKGKYEIVTADDNLPGKVLLYEKPGRDCFTNKHWHKNLEIDFIIRGCMWTNLGGEDRDLYGGDYILINSEAVHQTCGKYPDEPVKYLVVLFSYNYIKSYFPDFDNYYFDVNKNEQTRARIRDLLKALVFEAENHSEFSKLKMSCAMAQILMNLFTKCKLPRELDPDVVRSETGPDYIAKAIDYIKDNYRDRITLEEISSFVGLTPTYFSRYFSAMTGKTFKNYLNSVRLENTLIDIQQNGMSETRASLENGFPSVKSFITVFKGVYGCAPSEYVKIYQEEAPITEIYKK